MTKNIKLNMSRRIRRTPYTNMVEEHGVSDFTVVNHMLLPKGFKNTVETDYWHLSKDVQISVSYTHLTLPTILRV